MQVAGRVGVAPVPPRDPMLIYDGSCGFCRRWVARAKRLDRRAVVRYVALQDPTAPRVSGRSWEALARAAHFVRPDGMVFAGAAAVREYLRNLPGGWLVRAVSAIPGVMPLAECVYAWIARRWGPAP